MRCGRPTGIATASHLEGAQAVQPEPAESSRRQPRRRTVDKRRWQWRRATLGIRPAQTAPASRPISHRGWPAHVVTPAQEARLDITAAQARALVREVQRHDPSWKPRPSLYEGVEGQILANQSEAQQAAARLRELGAREPASKPLHDIFRPGGQMLGSRQGRASGGTRTVTRPEFSDLLEALSRNAQPVPSPRSYEGLWYRRPDGSVFGVRRSKDNGITIDVIRSNHRSIDNGDNVHKK